ncbi:phage tail tube protein [Desulfobulbus elongatus]|uniref:phage tail tube protein n=1 Tax=Desulfobulbus elongatus TaxID=53332 RepID=UPI0004885DFF|nr:phage tail tube protein [Desulfobulbus elongatus]
MTHAKGSRSQVTIQQEESFGIAPSSPDAQLLYYSSCTLALNRGQEQDDTLRGNRNPTKATRGSDDISGELAVNMQAYNGLLFLGLLGAVDTAGAASPYTHVFTIGAELPSFLIEKGFLDIDQYFRYLGCKIGSLKVSITPFGAQKMTFGIMGAQEVTASAAFDATPADLTYMPFDGFALGTLQEGGMAIADVTGVDLEISNDLDGDQYLLGGQGKRADIPEGRCSVSGTLRARFTNLALYTKAIEDATSSLKMIFGRGTGTGTAGNESLEFFIPELTFSPKAPPISGPKGIVVELPFVGYYGSAAGASALQITLKSPTSTIE